LTAWLRKKGIKANKHLHTPRKEFGSQICAVHGIHAASGALRHADIGVTGQFYTDSVLHFVVEAEICIDDR
jgi:hypothetical protein